MITETRHYYKVPFEITYTIKFKKMKLSAQVLYMVMCRIANNYANEEGWFYHSINDFSEKSGLQRKTVLTSKKDLEKNGYIDVKRSQYAHTKQRACNYYRINGFSFAK